MDEVRLIEIERQGQIQERRVKTGSHFQNGNIFSRLALRMKYAVVRLQCYSNG